MKLKLASALIVVVVGALGIVGTKATGATHPLVRVTPGYVFVRAGFDLTVVIYNPTGRSLAVTGHLVSPANFVTSTDRTTTVDPHSSGTFFWSCGAVTNCPAVPVFTSRSGKTAYTLRFQDTTNVFQAVYAGQMKRV